jgi:hypothetical protein
VGGDKSSSRAELPWKFPCSSLTVNGSRAAKTRIRSRVRISWRVHRGEPPRLSPVPSLRNTCAIFPHPRRQLAQPFRPRSRHVRLMGRAHKGEAPKITTIRSLVRRLAPLPRRHGQGLGNVAISTKCGSATQLEEKEEEGNRRKNIAFRPEERYREMFTFQGGCILFHFHSIHIK